MSKSQNSNSMITPKCMFSYVELHKAKKMVKKGKKIGSKKYRMVICFPKNEVKKWDGVKKAHKKVLKLAFKGKVSKLDHGKTAWRDGADVFPKDAEMRDMYVMSVASNPDRKPALFHEVDGDRVKIKKETDLYSGCFGHVEINFWSYDNGNSGISCGINSLLKTDDGTNLGGGSTGKSAYDSVKGAKPKKSGKNKADKKSKDKYESKLILTKKGKKKGKSIKKLLKAGWTNKQLLKKGYATEAK